MVRCLGQWAPELCLRAQVEVGRSRGRRAAQVEETEARPVRCCRNMKIEVGRKDTVDFWRLFCASEDLGSVSRTHVSTEGLEPGSDLGFVSLEG